MKLQPKTQGAFLVNCPGKITPYLHVLGKRADGYHDIQLARVPISIYDTLTFTPDDIGGIRLLVDSPQPLGAEQGNLIVRAARAFFQTTAQRPSFVIRVTKRIPVGAGLGGGSADAAATLIALNAAYGEPVPPHWMRSLAADLGTDVPFFLEPRPMRGSGRGEVMEPLPAFPRLHLLVVQPPFSSGTSVAYGAVQPGGPRPLPELGDPGAVVGALANDFEATLFRQHPELAAIKQALLDAGADGALLSGTGSALFGVFSSREARDTAAGRLKLPEGCRAIGCRTLARHRYFFRTAQPDRHPAATPA